MALGSSRFSITAGGGRARAASAKVARTVVQLGVSPGGTPNTLYGFGSESAIRATLVGGPLCEAVALRHRNGLTSYALAVEPTVDGDVGSVDHSGTGTGTFTVSVAPHVLVEIKISTGGALGTMKFRWRLRGTGAWSDPVASTASPDPNVFRVPGTFCWVSFPSGNYTLNATASIGVDGEVTTSGGAASAGSVTSSAGPFTIVPAEVTRISIDQGADQVFTWGGTRGYKDGAGAVFAGVAGTVVVRLNEDSTTDVTVTFDGTENSQAKALARFNEYLVRAAAVDQGGQIRLRNDRYGSSSTVRVVSGTGALLTDLGLATGLGTAGTATLDKGGGAVSKTIAFLDAATATEVAAAFAGGGTTVTGGTLTAVGTTLVLTTSTTGASPKGVRVQPASTEVLGFATTEVNGTTAGAIASVTQASSPLDSFEVLATVAKGGALGAAALRISLDDGKTSLPNLTVPSGGKVIIPNTGLVLTCSGTFEVDETYAFVASPPSYTSSDLDTAFEALRADRTFVASLIHVIDLPWSASDAFTKAETVQAQLDDAFDEGRDWQAIVEVPRVDDVIVSGGAAILDTADTESVLRTEREGLDLYRVSVFAGTHQMKTGRTFLRRPLGWAIVDRYVDVDPRESVSKRQQKLNISAIGWDEASASTSLDDVQINTAMTPTELPGEVYISITSGGFGWKNLTTSADWQNADAVRVLDTMLAALRPVQAALLGETPQVNLDGTIAEEAARAWDTLVDRAVKKALGLEVGGDFDEPQASTAFARIKRTSQLGTAPRKLQVEYGLQPLGYVSDVEGEVLFSGTLTTEG